MKFIVVFLAAIGAASAAKTLWFELEGYTFDNFVQEYGKRYASEAEAALRRSIFEDRLRQIRAHNADSGRTWKMGVNQLTDHTETELRTRLGYKKSVAFASKANKVEASPPFEVKPVSQLPTNVDWRLKGVVSAVKDQGNCGSCWTFGTTETIESHWAIAQGELSDLSEQQILDCTPNPNECGGTGGCNGGTAELAMDQIISMGGLSSEWTYPYISYFGANETCKFGQNTPAMVTFQKYVVLPSNQLEPVMTALATIGPLAVNVDASAWFMYESGVFDGCNQTNPDIDHVVQLVGYGTDPSLGDYWLVRNSWSPKWGEQGYIRLKRNATPICGTDLNPQDGTGCKNGPPTVSVCGDCAILYDVSYPLIGPSKK